MINFPIILPSNPAPKSVTISTVNLVGVNQSPFTGQTEIQLWPGEWLELQVTMPPIRDRITGEKFTAALASLRGQYGTFLYGDPTLITPMGSPSGTPLVNGVHTPGSAVLVTDGWTPSRPILRAGDYIQVGSAPQRLFKVMQDVSSNGSGVATIDIFPRVREQLADNTPIVFTNPMGTWMLNVNKSSWTKDEGGWYSISFTAREAF